MSGTSTFQDELAHSKAGRSVSIMHDLRSVHGLDVVPLPTAPTLAPIVVAGGGYGASCVGNFLLGRDLLPCGAARKSCRSVTVHLRPNKPPFLSPSAREAKARTAQLRLRNAATNRIRADGVVVNVSTVGPELSSGFCLEPPPGDVLPLSLASSHLTTVFSVQQNPHCHAGLADTNGVRRRFAKQNVQGTAERCVAAALELEVSVLQGSSLSLLA